MEMWDVYDREGRPTGRRVRRGDPLEAGEYHLAIEVWIVDDQGRILIQQRSWSCRTLPGVWGLTTGCVQAGEDSRAGCLREAREELGLHLRTEGLRLMRRIVREDGSRTIWDVYRFQLPSPSGPLALDHAEVERAAWVTPDAFLARLAAGELYEYPEIREVLRAVTDTRS